MNNKPHIGFVNAHPKGIGGNYNAGASFHPCILFFVPVIHFKTCMIMIGWNFIFDQEIGNFFGLTPVPGVNDPGSFDVIDNTQ